MRHLIVGTAGHIDHGKTKLVEALTGIDCDRWEEERRRGITIDLGFAHLATDNLEIGFIDVPGHERFLHNALAGLGGIRIMLLVVAADEGVEPQTLEHLEICSLLGIPRALVALTKCDLVGEDLRDIARLEVAELLAGSPWPEADVLPVSARTGEGVDDLMARLLEIAAELPEETRDDAPVRLPLDRAFQPRGLGSIVTGTLISGRIKVGQELALLPGEEIARVRSVQVHGEDRPVALAGERTALQLAGVALERLERGQQLAEPGAFSASTSLLARFELLDGAPLEIDGWTEVRFHLFSSEVVGRLRPVSASVLAPGEEAVVELRLAAPVVAVRGDRFVVRRPSPAATLGGGTILDPTWHRRRGRRLERAVAGLGGDLPEAILQWADDTRLDGIGAAELARRLGCHQDEARERLEELEHDGLLLRLEAGPSRPERWIAPSRLEDLSRRAERLLAGYLDRERLAAGMPKAEAVRRLMPRTPLEIADRHLERLAAAGVLVIDGDLLKIPGREAELTREESSLAVRLESAYREAGLQPPSPAELASRLGAKREIVTGVAHHLARQNVLVKLRGDLLISRRALEEARDELLRSPLDEFTVAEFRDHFELTRKWAIPILEYFDSQRVTARLGDVRKILAAASPPAASEVEDEP